MYCLNYLGSYGLDILSCDIHNAYLTSQFQKNIWTRAGPEFGSEAGMMMIVSMALYGLKYSGAASRAHLVETLNYIGLLSTKVENCCMVPA